MALIKTSAPSSSFDSASHKVEKRINRRTAVKNMTNAPGKMEGSKMAKTLYFVESNSEVPGTFSPRTSLKRQKSISAESLAGIRSGSVSEINQMSEGKLKTLEKSDQLDDHTILSCQHSSNFDQDMSPDQMNEVNEVKGSRNKSRQEQPGAIFDSFVLPRRSKCVENISTMDSDVEEELFQLDAEERTVKVKCSGHDYGQSDDRKGLEMPQKVFSLDGHRKMHGNPEFVLSLFLKILLRPKSK